MGLGAAANGAHAAPVYATEIDWNPGPGVTATETGSGGFDGNGSPTAGMRGDPDNALGMPDTTSSQDRFLSLGRGGVAVFAFGETFSGPADVFEVTFSCSAPSSGPGACSNHPEQVEVLTSSAYTAGEPTSLSGFTLQGTLQNATAQGGGQVSLTTGGPFTYLALRDTSEALGEQSFDGFDVDAVGVTPVPAPGAIGLLGVGLLGLGVAARRWRDTPGRT
jgi:hypothetical protein